MMYLRRLFCASAIAAAGSMMLLAQEPPGPPPFVSFPILMHVTDNGLDHGHFVEGPGETALPAPLNQTPAPGRDPGDPTPGTGIASGGEFDASSNPTSYEGETGAVSNGAALVGGSNHIYPGNCSQAALPGTFGDCAPLAYASLDDGATFTSSSVSRVWNGTTFGIGFDPGVDVDKTGAFYYSYGVAPLSGSYPNAIVMMKSADGVNWTKLTPVTFNKRRDFDDKYYLAIDRSSTAFANRIYVSWDRNSGNNQILYLAYSSTGGASWSAPIKVNDGTSKFERVIGAYPAVDQNTGVVYDSWHDYAKNIIYVDKSVNGGANWGRDVAAATTHAGFGADIGCVGGRSQGPAHALKVGPSGALYLVYADPVQGRGFDILLAKSTNGGASFGAPLRLNDDPAGNVDQFHPTLSVESNGAGGDKVTVSFYDRRDDPANCLAHVYATQSLDGGATWSANIRLTAAQSNFDGNPNGPGDYSSSTPHTTLLGPAVFPFFSQHLAGDYDVWTAVIR